MKKEKQLSGALPSNSLCQVENCERPTRRKSASLCALHYQRLRRSMGAGLQRDNNAYKGEDIGYSAAHERTYSEKGKPNAYACAICQKRNGEEWALIPDSKNIKRDSEGLYYSASPSDYAPLCRKCHKNLDLRTAHERAGQLPLFADTTLLLLRRWQ